MASGVGRRVTKSAVDWTKFAAVCPKRELDMLRATKARHDTFLNKVHALPENLPKIDFGSYKARLKDPAMADRFEKAYAALSIPYPVDKNNLMQKVEAEGKEKAETMKKYAAEVQAEIEASKSFLTRLDSLPKLNEMTMEMMHYYFPETAYNPERPTFWPHVEEEQPYNPDCKFIK